MFDVLDNPSAPPATDAELAAVLRAGRARVARRRLAVSGSAVAVLLVLGMAALAVSDRDGPPSVVDVVAPEPTTTTTTSTPTVEATDHAPMSTTTTTAKAAPVTSTSTTTTTTTAPTTTTTTFPRVEPRATEAGNPSLPSRPGVRLTLSLDRTSISSDETALGTLTIFNGSSEDVSIVPTACAGSHGGLYRNGDWVGGRPGRSCTGEYDPVVVTPGESYTISLRFDALGPKSPDETRPPLPSGVYQAAAGFYVLGEEGRHEAWFAPAVDVEIR